MSFFTLLPTILSLVEDVISKLPSIIEQKAPKDDQKTASDKPHGDLATAIATGEFVNAVANKDSSKAANLAASAVPDVVKVQVEKQVNDMLKQILADKKELGARLDAVLNITEPCHAIGNYLFATQHIVSKKTPLEKPEKDLFQPLWNCVKDGLRDFLDIAKKPDVYSKIGDSEGRLHIHTLVDFLKGVHYGILKTDLDNVFADVNPTVVNASVLNGLSQLWDRIDAVSQVRTNVLEDISAQLNSEDLKNAPVVAQALGPFDQGENADSAAAGGIDV